MSLSRPPSALATRGFTLIEVLVVITIIVIMGALIVPNIIDRPDEARVAIARGDIRAIASALDLYKLDNQAYPSTDQGLEALVSAPSGEPEAVNWNPEGYLKKPPVDPWGRGYLYISEGRGFDLFTLGQDGLEGGEGVNGDIYIGDL